MGEEVAQKEEEKKEGEEAPEIVLKVDMHCEACARKVARSLKGFQGVEEVRTDSKASKVVVKGKEADPLKVCERLQKKSGRKVQLVSPLPKPPQENNEQNKEPKSEPPKEDKKDEPPAVVTVVLSVRMHCDACAQVLQKRIRKIPGVETVETDVGNSKVTVKGVVDPAKLVEDVYKKTRKQVSIVKEEEKKQEEKKDEAKKYEEEAKKEAGGKVNEEEEKQNSEIKRSEYWPSRSYLEYSSAPHIFSDENPNACSLM